MAFNISYNFLASDKFTSVAKKVARIQDKVNRASSRGLKANINLANSANRVASSFRRSGSSLGRFFGKLKSVNGLIAGVAGIGVIAGIKKVITVGAGFQDSLANLSAITGITGKQLDKLGNSSKRLGREFGVLPSTIVETVKRVASAKSELIKVDGALEKVTRSALILGQGAAIPLTDSVESLTLSLNQFGASADQSNRFINVLAAGSKIGASEVADTTAAIKDSGTIAKATGVSFESLNALIQVLSKAGIKGARSGTKLRNVLLILDEAFSKGAPKIKNINDRLEFLRKANLSTGQSVKLFGRENVVAAKILANNIDLVKEYTVAITGTNVAQEQAAIIASTFSFRIRKLGVSIQEKLIQLFDKLEPKLIKLSERFKDFIGSITAEGVENFAKSLGGLFEVLGQILKVMTKVGKISGFLFSKEAAVGGAIGATLGSVVPVIGTGIGGILGAIVGAIGSANFAAITASLPKPKLDEITGTGSESNPTLDVNINAPPGIIDTIKSKSKGLTKLNVGQNLRPANATQ